MSASTPPDYLRDRLVAAVGDHYLIEEELGRGGMAAVFRALDVRLNRHVAIKLLPPELAFNPAVRSRFLREAQMAAQLSHPNIVPIYTVDEREGLVYFVMALVDGESLAGRLARSGPMPLDQVRTVAGDVADALDHAHRQGVVHRDIKPDNILLDRATGRPMVTDFGIARAAAEESRLTVTGMAVGTPAYMSPEQAMGERDVDGRSDIYSLGIVAYQMIAGETPFRATNTPAMLMKHVSEPPTPLRSRRPDVPASLASAVERALAKRPEDRWHSAAEMRDALLERTMARVYPTPPPPIEPRPFREETKKEGEGFSAGLIFQVPPRGLSRRERKDWYREQRRTMRDAMRHGIDVKFPERPVEEQIVRFRRQFASSLGTSVLLFGINMVTSPQFPWFIFPALAMFARLARQFGSLWSAGIPVKRMFFGPPASAPVSVVGPGASSPESAADVAAALSSKEVVEGSHGPAIRKAVASRQVISDLLKRMTPSEREMLPKDLESTVTALVSRVASVAMTLHRLDADANGTSLGSLDERIESLKHQAETSERERRLALLERQRTTLRDLLERRSILMSQLESASLALENLKLDLVRFRSAGVSTALEDVTSATREARAVSRDIEHMLEAAEEVRKL